MCSRWWLVLSLLMGAPFGAAAANGQVPSESKLTASDAAPGDQFGWSVSISGETVVVGASGDDDGGMDSGSAYVFELDAGGNWVQVAKLTAADAAVTDFFGYSVPISGDTIVVGAPFSDPEPGGTASGAAYVFERDHGGPDNWGQVAKLTAADALPFDNFGIVVSISGDTVVAGAPQTNQSPADGPASGSAYVFERNQGGPNNWGQVARLTAADAAVGDEFGAAVSISGDTVVIGALTDDDAGSESGSAYVFEKNQDDNWVQVAKLTAADAAAGDQFGFLVSISEDTLLVGARLDDDAGADSGSAYVFEKNQAGDWTQVAKLVAGDAAAGDEFGFLLSLDGDTAVVGARLDDDGGIDSGSAYVFKRDEGGADNWGQVAKLVASDAGAADEFGWSVAASGDTVVVGARLDDDGGIDSGSAYVFALPQRVCDLNLEYAGGTLTLGFELATLEPVDWNLFFTVLNQVGTVWSGVTILVIDPIQLDLLIEDFPHLGRIGFLMTFVKRDVGIVCSDFEVVDTGSSPVTPDPEAVRDLILRRGTPRRR